VRKRFLPPSPRKRSVAIVVLLTAAVIVGVSGAARSASSAKSASTVKSASTAVTQLYPPSGVDWSTGSGDLANTRFSSLNQINTSNVGTMKVAWAKSFDTAEQLGPNGAFSGIQQVPIESNGVLYIATPNGVVAINAVTGASKWTFVGTAPLQAPCFGPGFCLGSSANGARDISMGDGMVFAGLQDGSVVALNQNNGQEVWQANVASIGTTAGTVRETNPWTVYANGVVLTTVDGGDSPIQGHIDAYNAKTGALLWRWFSTPDPTTLPFILTWTNPAEAATGGGAVWVRPAIDTKLNRVYIETGNAHANLSDGKNLWTSSVVSLDLQTGKLMWYFQGIHHDQWDFDCSTPPVLYNATVNGKTVPAVAATCKTGYIFMLDRRNGRQIFPIKEVPVPNPGNQPLGATWPTQPETSGGSASVITHCPTLAQVTAQAGGKPPAAGTSYLPTCQFPVPDPAATEVYGATSYGGPDFWPMSFDPQTNDLYVCANGAMTGAGGSYPQTGIGGYVSALNMSTNKLDWQLVWPAEQYGGCLSGVLSTAGGLVFTSSFGQAVFGSSLVTQPFGGSFYAYDAKTGKQLFSFKNSSIIQAPPITYSVGGKQYVAVDMTSGVNPTQFLPSATGDMLTVFTLP
jgi:quinohemoprotein ethanol dehydrogenase